MDNTFCLKYKDGSKYWYENGKLHNLDGPAVVHGATAAEEFFVGGVKYSSMEEIGKKNADLNYLLDSILELLEEEPS